MTQSTTKPEAQLAHASLVVHSLTLETTFYSSVLGLPMGNRVDMGDHIIQYVESGTSVILEFIEYQDGRTLPDHPDQEFRHHLAFAVNDIERTLLNVQSAGGTIINPPSSAEKLGFQSAMVQDPEGFRIEIVHYFGHD
jgi:predicted enzyme related to lactoylglutathione lyase